jgi:putative chitinase
MKLTTVLIGLLSLFALPIQCVNTTQINEIQQSHNTTNNHNKTIENSITLTQTNDCITRINKYQGSCISPNTCTGGIYNNLCPGNKKCCVQDIESAPWFYWKYVNNQEFKSIFSSVSSERADTLLPWFNKALSNILDDTMGNNDCNIIAAFSAQIGHESGSLMLFEELASGEAYEGRCKNLGNCQTGDGIKYKGRGAIQITGRSNYQSLTNSIGTDFINKPELLVLPSNGFQASVWYWNTNKLNKYCTGKVNDFFELTRRINGGTNGIDDRLSRWSNAKTVLKC